MSDSPPDDRPPGEPWFEWDAPDDRPLSRFERALRLSCLGTLVIVVLLAIVVRPLFALPLPGKAAVVVLVWLGLLAFLMRRRTPRTPRR